MITKLDVNNLRNAEYYQFMQSALAIFDKYGIDRANLEPLYEEMRHHLHEAELALAYEKQNEKVRLKNDANRYRNRLHSKLFNYIKSILYDERDGRFDSAQIIMRVLREVGNPTRLDENAESEVFTTLSSRLAPFHNHLYAIGAHQIMESINEANRVFIALEVECQKVVTENNLSKPHSLCAVRKQLDLEYRIILNAINS